MVSKSEPIACMLFWLLSIIISITVFRSLNYTSEKTKNICNISIIYYPISFEDDQFWFDCNCYDDFCIPKCYCVKMYDINSNFLTSNENSNCSYVGNNIPYNFDFTPLLNRYKNKEIECFYDSNNDSYYLEYDSRYTKSTIFNFLMSYIVILTFICCIYQCFRRSNVTLENTDDNITFGINIDNVEETEDIENLDNNEDIELPEYDIDNPPEYDDTEIIILN